MKEIEDEMGNENVSYLLKEWETFLETLELTINLSPMYGYSIL